MNSDNLDKLVSQALAIEAESAREAGALGFMARLLVQITLPHRSIQGNEFVRTNGDLTVTMLAPSKTAVRVIYPDAKFSEGDHGLVLKPSKPHIPAS